ncbi:MAG: hypothetical protein ACI9VR_000608 [Cognaticolwellia sp.]|jgi:hypothetical protein
MTNFQNAYAEVHVSDLPFVVVVVVGPVTEEGYLGYLQALLEAVQLRRRVVIRMHAGPMIAFPPRFVQMSVAWLKRHEEVLARHVVAVTIVMESPALRMAAQAMLWAATPPFPLGATRTKAEADAWLLARMDEDEP